MDDVLGARARLLKNKAAGPDGTLSADMLHYLCPTVLYVIAWQFAKRLANPTEATVLHWAKFIIIFLPKIMNADTMQNMRGVSLINSLLK